MREEGESGSDVVVGVDDEVGCSWDVGRLGLVETFSGS